MCRCISVHALCVILFSRDVLRPAIKTHYFCDLFFDLVVRLNSLLVLSVSFSRVYPLVCVLLVASDLTNSDWTLLPGACVCVDSESGWTLTAAQTAACLDSSPLSTHILRTYLW